MTDLTRQLGNRPRPPLEAGLTQSGAAASPASWPASSGSSPVIQTKSGITVTQSEHWSSGSQTGQQPSIHQEVEL